MTDIIPAVNRGNILERDKKPFELIQQNPEETTQTAFSGTAIQKNTPVVAEKKPVKI